MHTHLNMYTCTHVNAHMHTRCSNHRDASFLDTDRNDF